MTRDELKSALDARDGAEFVDTEILSKRPWIFDSDSTYNQWRTSLASELSLQSESIRIVGSAATGFSLSPLKPGRPFRRTSDRELRASDVDIAIVDLDLFLSAWNTVVQFDRLRSLRESRETRDKIRFDVYWGLVGQKSLPQNTAPARKLLTGMSVAGRSPPLRGHPVQCRIYRRFEDLRAYHIASIRLLRAKLTETTNG